MKKLFWLPLLALPLLPLTSCDDDTNANLTECGADVPPPPAGYKVLLRIDTLRDAQRQLQFVLRARDNQSYACGNYTLQTVLYAKDKKLLLSVCDAQLQGACLTTPGPATAFNTISGYAGANYPLELNIRGKRSTGMLNLLSIPYQVVLDDTTYAAVRR